MGLLQVATGVSGDILGSTEDFQIQRLLGQGMQGKVVQVRRTAPGRSQLPELCALKLHKGPPECSSSNEAEILAALEHPFCVRILYYFSLSEDQHFRYDTGEVVDGDYKFGIMMELCTEGNLLQFLETRPTWVNNTRAPPRENLQQEGPLQRAYLDLLHLWHRFGVELAIVFAFLHGRDPVVAYRDLKTDNVLMRKGRDSELHICLTDFGLSKQPTLGNELQTPGGNGPTVAPEVPRQGQPPSPYNERVDNWAFGQVLLQMLWCTYDDYGVYGKVPVVPARKLWEDGHDPRVPKRAADLIHTLTQQDPNSRGTMQQAANADFFTKPFDHLGRHFPAIEKQNLLDAAKR